MQSSTIRLTAVAIANGSVGLTDKHSYEVVSTTRW